MSAVFSVVNCGFTMRFRVMSIGYCTYKPACIVFSMYTNKKKFTIEGIKTILFKYKEAT